MILVATLILGRVRLKHTKPHVSATAFKLLNTSSLPYTPTRISKTVCHHRLLATIPGIWRQSSLLPHSLSSSPRSCTQVRIASRWMGPLSLRLFERSIKIKDEVPMASVASKSISSDIGRGYSGNTQTCIRRVTMNASLLTQTSYLCSLGQRK